MATKFIRVNGRVIPLKTAAAVGGGVAAGTAGAILAHRNAVSMTAKASANFAKYKSAHSAVAKTFSGLGKGAAGKIASRATYVAGKHKAFRIGKVQMGFASLSKKAAIGSAAVAIGSAAAGLYAYHKAERTK